MINHIPVMLEESIKSLDIKQGGIYIDATLGGGGYSKRILNRLKEIKENSTLICFDIDIDAIENFKVNLENSIWKELNQKITYSQSEQIKIILINDNFANLKLIIDELVKNQLINKELEILGIIADLGLNSDQLDKKKGFSFQNLEQELDMRLDKNSGVKASDLLIVGSTKQLSELFSKYGDLNNSWKLAQNIKELITKADVRVKDLVKIIDRTFGKSNAIRNDIHSKVFQSLRIAVNNEYHNLEELLKNGLALLGSEGRMVIISFHSGEDRIIKHFIIENEEKILVLNDGKIQIATETEVSKNLRARSAKLRGFIKLIQS